MKRISMARIKHQIRSIDSLAENVDVVVGVSRRGVIPASIIAVRWGKPLEWVAFTDGGKTVKISFDRDKNTRYLFVDDVLAKGRTADALHLHFPDARLLVVVRDASLKGYADVLSLMTESEWCYFDWEDKDKVVNNDHGLFRDRSAEYGNKCRSNN